MLVDGHACRPRDLVGPGAKVEVDPAPPPPSAAEPDSSVHFGVLFEDEHLIVVDKPPGLSVHPSGSERTGTLVNGLLARGGFERATSDPRDPDGYLRPGIVQRLDKDTSGALVVAKDEITREGLKEQLGARTAKRSYRAITLGVPRVGKIETLHGRHPKSRIRFTSRIDRGRNAVTQVEQVETLLHGAAAFIGCRLQTGRTHQIRVHLAEASGCPVLADKVYGRPPTRPDLRQVAEELGRQALHAAELGFVHPVTRDQLSFVSPLPDDMSKALERLREG